MRCTYYKNSYNFQNLHLIDSNTIMHTSSFILGLKTMKYPLSIRIFEASSRLTYLLGFTDKHRKYSKK